MSRMANSRLWSQPAGLESFCALRTGLASALPRPLPLPPAHIRRRAHSGRTSSTQDPGSLKPSGVTGGLQGCLTVPEVEVQSLRPQFPLLVKWRGIAAPAAQASQDKRKQRVWSAGHGGARGTVSATSSPTSLSHPAHRLPLYLSFSPLCSWLRATGRAGSPAPLFR